jgi:hypothetical protein
MHGNKRSVPILVNSFIDVTSNIKSFGVSPSSPIHFEILKML